jgi:polyisoprenoid-binding protein YceI
MLLVSAAACDKKEDAAATPAISASSIVPPAPPAGPKAVRYVIDPASKTTIDMHAPKERIRAETTAANGELTVDPTDLRKTAGQIKVDLTTLTTSTFNDPSKVRH